MRLLACVGLLLAAPAAWALHESEAGVVDWHKPLVGVPLTDWLGTAPAFRRVKTQSEERNIILTATGSNVLAALDPSDGSLLWRFHYGDRRDQVASYCQNGTVVASLSGSGGANLRLFDVLTGNLIFEKHLHSPERGRLTESNLGTSLAFHEHSVLTLTNAHEVHRIDATTGELIWAWTAPDMSSLVLYSDIIPTADAIYLVGLAKSFESYTLHITALDPSSGASLTSLPIPSSIKQAADFMLLPSAQRPLVAWLEGSTIKSVALARELRAKPVALKGAYVHMIDVGLGAQGQLVAVKADGTGRVVKRDEQGVLKAIWDFKDSATSELHSPSFYAGGVDADGLPYIARVYWSLQTMKAIAQVYGAHLNDGKGTATTLTFPFRTDLHGVIRHAALDLEGTTPRLVLTTSTGAVQMWEGEEERWTREEALAYTSVAEFVDLPAPIHDGRAGDSEGILQRVMRHIVDAQNLPAYIRSFVTRRAATSTVALDEDALARDAFGLRKLVIASSPFGKIYALDSRTGEIVWSRMMGIGWAAEVGAKLFPVKLFTLRSAADGRPEVVLVTQRRAENSLIDTVLFHVDALTGDDASPDLQAGAAILEGLDVIAGPLVQAYLLPTSTAGNIIVLVDEYQQVHLYPDTDESQVAFAATAPDVHFHLRTGTQGQRKVMGHRVMGKPDAAGKFLAFPAWTFSLPAAEEVRALVSPPRAPIASLGRVRGNKTTSYKYLNPNVVALVTGGPAGCGVYVLDGAKGSVLYHVRVKAVACDIKAALAENWLVYHYYDSEAKGYRMVSVELYEGQGVDDRTKSSDMSSYDEEMLNLSVHEQAFECMYDISAIAMTTTKFGITAKDVIVATKNGHIQTIPRRALDPRRPHIKPTAEEVEEGLVQYDPLVPDDPRRIISHRYHMAETKGIVIAPALLESTAIVFTYGLDLFCSRVSPSGTFDVLSENFNKPQLLLTIGGLVIAIAVARPMVRRKILRERWYE